MESLSASAKNDHAALALDRCRPQRKAIEQGKIRFHALARGGYPGQRIGRQVLPGLRSLGFWDAVGEQDWGLEWHRNDGIEICLLETGVMPFAMDQHEYLLSPGQLTLTLPWQAHVLGNPNVGWGRLHWIILDVHAPRPTTSWRWPDWIVLTPADRAELADRIKRCGHPVWQASPDIRETFRHIAQRLEAAPHASPHSALAVCINHLLLDLLELLRHTPSHTDAQPSEINRAVRLLLKELEQEPGKLAHRWTVSEMAQRCGMGITAFTDCCRRISNTTPSDYLLRCRLRAAAQLIRQQPQRKIVDIALSCGFSSSQYFATRFQQHFACSPSSYRRRGGVGI